MISKRLVAAIAELRARKGRLKHEAVLFRRLLDVVNDPAHKFVIFPDKQVCEMCKLCGRVALGWCYDIADPSANCACCSTQHPKRSL